MLIWSGRISGNTQWLKIDYFSQKQYGKLVGKLRWSEWKAGISGVPNLTSTRLLVSCGHKLGESHVKDHQNRQLILNHMKNLAQVSCDCMAQNSLHLRTRNTVNKLRVEKFQSAERVCQDVDDTEAFFTMHEYTKVHRMSKDTSPVANNIIFDEQ